MAGYTIPPIEALLISASPGELRAAIMRGGLAWELMISRDTRPSRVGDVHLGRIRRVERGLDAAFVDIGEGEPAFLPLPPGRPPSPPEGETLLVQVTRDGFDGKGPTVSRRIALPGRYVVYAPTRPGVAAGRRLGDANRSRHLQGLVMSRLQPHEGVILRSAALLADETGLLHELEGLRQLWQKIAAATEGPRRVHTDLPPLQRLLRDRGTGPSILFDDAQALAAAQRYAAAHAPELTPALSRWREAQPLFEAHGIEAEIEAALGGSAVLPSGGMLHFGSTRALTAIDVDSGRHAGRGRAADTLLELDLEAALEAARLIRLRNLAGLIVIDFASLSGKARREAVDARLRAAFAEDVAESRLMPISDLGLAEISRQRLGPSLPDLLGAPCAACAGGGRVPDPETVGLAALRAVLRADAAAPGGRPVLAAPSAVIAALETTLAAARRTAEERLGQTLTLRAEGSTAPHWTKVEMTR